MLLSTSLVLRPTEEREKWDARRDKLYIRVGYVPNARYNSSRWGTDFGYRVPLVIDLVASNCMSARPQQRGEKSDIVSPW
jgi:hypothetical protein